MGSGESEALVQLGRAWGCGDGLGTGCWVSLGGEQWKKRSLAQPRAGVGASVPAGHRLPRVLPESAARLGSPTPHTRAKSHPSFLFHSGKFRHLPCSLPGHSAHSLLSSFLAKSTAGPCCVGCPRHTGHTTLIMWCHHVHPWLLWGNSTTNTRVSRFSSSASLTQSHSPFYSFKKELSRSKNLGEGEEDLEKKKKIITAEKQLLKLISS